MRAFSNLLVVLTLILGVTALAVPSVKAQNTGNILQGVDNTGSCASTPGNPRSAEEVAECRSGGGVQRTVTNIVNLLSLIVGIIAVIMIIIAGLMFITAAGDSGKVANARNTILYAAIGLVIVAIAQTIVRFVLDKATQ